MLPLPNSTTADPTDKVVGVDFSGSFANVVTQLNAALGSSNLQFSASPPPATAPSLRAVNSNSLSNITAASVTTTAPANSLTPGNAQLSLFTDNGVAYSGAITSTGSQITGLAGRITVNNAIVADPSKLVQYSPTTAAGDTTRSDFILGQLTTGNFTYSPQTGVGSSVSPFKGTLLSFMQQFTSQQGATASTASQLADGQNVVLNTLQQKMTTESGVNIDDEMAHLLSLQNAYSANARVMSTVSDMYKTLMNSM